MYWETVQCFVLHIVLSPVSTVQYCMHLVRM